MKKILTLQEAVADVQDGDTVALGGNVLHRAPMAFVREMARQKKKELKLVKTAGAHDIDLLCALDCVQSVEAGFVSYETKYGLAPHYRKAVESGKVTVNEHACYTVICALRAAAMNVPFMPVKGLCAGDLLVKNDYFVVVEDPFGGEPVTLVKAIVPDVAIIHVHECDQHGNARIYGPRFEDVLMTRAAKKVILTTEQIVPRSRMKLQAEYIDIPGFLVDAIVHVPQGASPCSCYKKYDIDDQALRSYLAMQNRDEIESYLKRYERKDYAGERMAVWV
ncbi:CoA-transferase [Caldalkalibacillus thermarum]|uniref:CoA transferase subunit A n=1 Tax=Caldalkalibacillus thermarum TaxID=296745 RepID=UPI001668BADB|nr:CoA transferase subunit A [Caldalkalibacillus thermarum]GGK30295.1 CoA-transferase [Caldalkalibacillus thermarum]